MSPTCEHCGGKTHSKGFRRNKIKPTYRLYRCVDCKRITTAPELDRQPYQQVGDRPMSNRERAQRWRDKQKAEQTNQ